MLVGLLKVMLADRTLTGLKMIGYTDVEIKKNVFIERRVSLDDKSFDWEPKKWENKLQNCPSIVKNTLLDLNDLNFFFLSVCGLPYEVIFNFCFGVCLSCICYFITLLLSYLQVP